MMSLNARRKKKMSQTHNQRRLTARPTQIILIRVSRLPVLPATIKQLTESTKLKKPTSWWVAVEPKTEKIIARAKTRKSVEVAVEAFGGKYEISRVVNDWN